MLRDKIQTAFDELRTTSQELYKAKMIYDNARVSLTTAQNKQNELNLKKIEKEAIFLGLVEEEAKEKYKSG